MGGFSISFSEHLTGHPTYCSIMGHGGQHYSLGIYIGEKGFSTYLSSLNMPDNQLEVIQRGTTYDCITCDFMQADEIDTNVKKVIRAYATSHGRKIPRKHGWIDFTRFSPYKAQWTITKQEDAHIAVECLKAATFFSGYFIGKTYQEVGLDPMGQYPSFMGGKSIPLIIPQEDGSYKVSKTETPDAIIEPPACPTFANDILAHQIKSLPKTSAIECRLLHAPTGVMVEGEEIPILPGTILFVEKESGRVLMPFMTTDYPEHTPELLTELANHMAAHRVHPSQIDVCDEKTFRLLESFCEKCGIGLNITKHPRHIDEVCSFFIMQMMGA